MAGGAFGPLFLLGTHRPAKRFNPETIVRGRFMIAFTSDQWIIVALVFVLGMLIGMFLTAGGRRKWRTRYQDEIARRETLEREHRKQTDEWVTKEKEWRERDSLRGAAIKNKGADVDGDGVPDAVDRRPVDDTRA